MGLLQGKTPTSHFKVDTPELITDGNFTSSGRLNPGYNETAYARWEFNELMDLTRILLNWYNSDGEIRFLDKDNFVISSYTKKFSDVSPDTHSGKDTIPKYLDVDLKGVKAVELFKTYSSTSPYIYEFDVDGTPSTEGLPIVEDSPLPVGKFNLTHGMTLYGVKSPTDTPDMATIVSDRLTDNNQLTSLPINSDVRFYKGYFDVPVDIDGWMFLTIGNTIYNVYYYDENGNQIAYLSGSQTSDGTYNDYPSTYQNVSSFAIGRAGSTTFDISSIVLYGEAPVIPIQEKYLLKDQEEFYTYKNGVLTNLGSQEDTDSLYQENGMSLEEVNAIPSSVWNQLSITVDTIRWTDDLNAAPRQVQWKVVPEDVILVSNFDIDLSVVSNIDFCKAVGTTFGNGKIALVFSNDFGETWQSYKNGEFVDCWLTTESVLTNGMSIAEFNAVPSEAWNYINTNGVIRFGFAMSLESYTDKAMLDKITIQVDIQGNYKLAHHSEHYNIVRPNSTLLELTINQQLSGIKIIHPDNMWEI